MTRVLFTHPPEACQGQHCCIHNPSEHHMRSWTMLWREDRKLMERICPHGVGHPDPDDVAHHLREHPEDAAWYDKHGCDGCCTL